MATPNDVARVLHTYGDFQSSVASVACITVRKGARGKVATKLRKASAR